MIALKHKVFSFASFGAKRSKTSSFITERTKGYSRHSNLLLRFLGGRLRENPRKGLPGFTHISHQIWKLLVSHTLHFENLRDARLFQTLIYGNPRLRINAICFTLPVIIPLLLAWAAGAGYAQNRFVNYGIYDGLVTDVFKCVAIDSAGIVWFGSKGQGANSYDGSTWKQYNLTNTPIDYSSIRYITVDSKNRIWFATSFGVHRYDGRIWTTVLFNSDSYRVAEDRLGQFWVATKEGLYASKGATWELYTHAQGLPEDSLNYVYADSRNLVWIGTKTRGLVRFDGTSFQRMDWADDGTPTEIRVIQEDRLGRLWIGTRFKGVAVYDGTGFKVYDQSTGLNSDNVWGMAVDSTGNMWFATYSGGLSMFDGRRWYNYTRKNDGLLLDWTDDVAVDRHGNLWIATDAGISFLPLENTKHISDCDLNGDGRYNVLDVLALLQLVLHNPADPRTDRDRNGQTDLQDVVLFLRNITNGTCP